MTISNDSRERIIEMRRDGMLLKVIAYEVGCGVISVWRVCKAAGVYVPQTRPRKAKFYKAFDPARGQARDPLSAAEQAYILDRRREGALMKQIAFEAHCDVSTVYRLCKQAGVGKIYSEHPTSVRTRRLYATNGRRAAANIGLAEHPVESSFL